MECWLRKDSCGHWLCSLRCINTVPQLRCTEAVTVAHTSELSGPCMQLLSLWSSFKNPELTRCAQSPGRPASAACHHSPWAACAADFCACVTAGPRYACGCLVYSPPEVLAVWAGGDAPVDPYKHDVFSVGVLIFEVCVHP